jgi:hypothetical protein
MGSRRARLAGWGISMAFNSPTPAARPPSRSSPRPVSGLAFEGRLSRRSLRDFAGRCRQNRWRDLAGKTGGRSDAHLSKTCDLTAARPAFLPRMSRRKPAFAGRRSKGLSPLPPASSTGRVHPPGPGCRGSSPKPRYRSAAHPAPVLPECPVRTRFPNSNKRNIAALIRYVNIFLFTNCYGEATQSKCRPSPLLQARFGPEASMPKEVPGRARARSGS